MPRVSMCEALEELKDAQQTEEEIRFLSDYWHENWSWSRLTTEEQRQIEQEKAKQQSEEWDDLMMASIRLAEREAECDWDVGMALDREEGIGG